MINWDDIDTLDSVLWQCGDCGNYYEYSITSCPNTALDKLLVAYEGHKIREREQDEAMWLRVGLAERDLEQEIEKARAWRPSPRDLAEAQAQIKRHKKHKEKRGR